MKKIRFYTRNLSLALILSLISSPSFSHLPDLGAEYRSTLSVNDERLIGESWMQQIRGAGMVYYDPIVNDYIQYLGNKLTPYVNMPYPELHIKFFVVDDNTVNAFAFFGGHIAVHSGLILITQSESELAGVMSHELGHIAQQHILRQVTESKRLMPITLAQTLAAALLGVPELIIPVLGNHSQQMLNFSRQHEQEADRVGMQILSSANFDPQGLPNIFERMSMHLRYENRPPEYLLSHPLYDSRISDTRHRAHSFVYKQKSNSMMFHLIKARLEVQRSTNVQQLISEFEHKLKTKRYSNDLATRYGYAYALLQNGKTAAAANALSALMTEYPEDLIIQMTAANIEAEANNHAAAQKRLEAMLSIYPDSSALQLQYIELLLQRKQPKAAKKVLAEYKMMHTPEPNFYELSRHADGMLGNQLGVYEANAEWYALNGDPSSALKQLQLALDLKTSDPKATTRLKNRYKEIAELEKNRKTI
jgi:predicted Zn-dependent protease